MRDVFIPVSARESIDKEATLLRVKQLGAKRVFLAIERMPFKRDLHTEKILSAMRELVGFYKAEGLEVGLWTQTLGFGGKTKEYNAENGFTRIRSVSGKECDDAICPLDPGFVSAMCDMITDLARLSPDMIMLDDELCLSVRPGIGCACERHMQKLCDRLGERITRDDIAAKVFCGSPDRYRKAWFSLMGDTLADFCKKLRDAVDSIDPDIRMGFCAGYTSWDFEGTDALSLTGILAGGTLPFLRFTGAPYWHATHRFDQAALEVMIESVRIQNAWAKDSGVEVFAEGDSYPRVQYQTPVSYCEIFDLVLRGFCGIDMLKYVFTYDMDPSYDSGYYTAHIKNSVHIERLAQASGDMTGVRIYEAMRKIQNAELPDSFSNEKKLMKSSYLPDAAKLFCGASIPTVYDGRGICGAAFGENARYLTADDIKNGMILDLKAALILKDNGIDTGVISYKKAEGEYYEQYGDGKIPVELYSAGDIYELTLNKDAKAQGYFVSADLLSDKKIPSCYYYRNKDGQRFFVYAWSGSEQCDQSALYLNYYRGEQLAKAVRLVSGKDLPVTVSAHPHLYCLCKQSKNTLYTACFNMQPDTIDKLTLTFDNEYKCEALTGKITAVSGNSITLDSIPPFSYILIKAVK